MFSETNIVYAQSIFSFFIKIQKIKPYFTAMHHVANIASLSGRVSLVSSTCLEGS